MFWPEMPPHASSSQGDPRQHNPQSPGSDATPAAEALIQGLTAAEPWIAPRFLYDLVGSRLFAAITALDEYYLTRAEAEILAMQLPDMLATHPVAGCTMIDIGAGNCEKAAALFDSVRPAHYVAVDVSVDYLATALNSLRTRFPDIGIAGIGIDFSAGLRLPSSVPTERRLFFYPGSSIGNFTPAQAEMFLTSIRREMAADGALWIGVDLHKDKAVLERAYDDALGVTSAFNHNILRNANRIAATDFDVDDWRYLVEYDEKERHVAMYLVARKDVVVSWQGGERRFATGERIHTESSYKHTRESFTELLERSGMRRAGCWTDQGDQFALFVATPA